MSMIEVNEYDGLLVGNVHGIYGSNGVLVGSMIELDEGDIIKGQQTGLYSGGVVFAGPQIELEEWLNLIIGKTVLPSEDFHITQAGNNQEVFTGATYPKLGDNMRLIDYLEDPEPDADFTSNRVDGIAPFAVQFQDMSIGPHIVAWRWNFGDGITSRQQNPNHVFLTPGKYTVILRVYSYTQQDTIVRHEYISAGILDFQADHTSGPVKLKCRFNAEIVLP